MYNEENGQTANHRDGIFDEFGEELYKEHDFVCWTDLPVK